MPLPPQGQPPQHCATVDQPVDRLGGSRTDRGIGNLRQRSRDRSRRVAADLRLTRRAQVSRHDTTAPVVVHWGKHGGASRRSRVGTRRLCRGTIRQLSAITTTESTSLPQPWQSTTPTSALGGGFEVAIALVGRRTSDDQRRPVSTPAMFGGSSRRFSGCRLAVKRFALGPCGPPVG